MALSSDFVDEALPALPSTLIRHEPRRFFPRPSGAQILWTNQEDNTLHESEGVPQHELFHFLVVEAAPVGPGQERPADFDLALVFVVPVESRRPDDLAALESMAINAPPDASASRKNPLNTSSL